LTEYVTVEYAIIVVLDASNQDNEYICGVCYVV